MLPSMVFYSSRYLTRSGTVVTTLAPIYSHLTSIKPGRHAYIDPLSVWKMKGVKRLNTWCMVMWEHHAQNLNFCLHRRVRTKTAPIISEMEFWSDLQRQMLWKRSDKSARRDSACISSSQRVFMELSYTIICLYHDQDTYTRVFYRTSKLLIFAAFVPPWYLRHTKLKIRYVTEHPLHY